MQKSTKIKLKEHVQTADAEDAMMLLVDECSCFPTHDDQTTFKIVVSVSAELHPVLIQIIRAFTKLGADIRFGATPRTNLERLTQASLDIVRSF